MPAGQIQFGEFLLDRARYELRRSGRHIRLERIPMELLILLVERSDQLLTRQEIIGRLWGPDVFVDTDQGINQAIRKIRTALHDDPEKPRFVETVVGKGYRFVAPIELRDNGSPETSPAVASVGPRRGRYSWALATGVAVAVALVSYAVWPRPQPAAIERRIMLAVLPFENMSGDAQQDYVSDGMTEEMITVLGRLNPERLGVIARTSVMRYKGSTMDVRDIGRDLDVQYILEGSVRSDGTRVRVTAQLIQLEDRTHVWAESYERDLRDVLGLHQDIATAVAGSISATFRDRRAAPVHSVDPAAYEQYLRGRFFWAQRTGDSLRRGLAHFQKAVEIEPDFAAAYAGIADSYALLEYGRYISPQEAYPKALAAVTKALDIDPVSPQANLSLGYIRNHYEWDWTGSESVTVRAVALDPNYALGHQWYAYFLSQTGRLNQAVEEGRRAIQLDPVNLTATLSLAGRLRHAGRLDEAISHLNAAAQFAPESPLPHQALARTYEKKGELEHAAEAFDRMLVLWHEPELLSFYRRLRGREGHLNASRATWARETQIQLRDLQQRSQQGEYVSPADFADTYAVLGDRRNTLRWLEKAYLERSSLMLELRAREQYDFLRSDPLFLDLLRRVGVPQYPDVPGPSASIRLTHGH